MGRKEYYIERDPSGGLGMCDLGPRMERYNGRGPRG